MRNSFPDKLEKNKTAIYLSYMYNTDVENYPY